MFKPEVGKPCSFYHAGGFGERRWVIGWRYGIVRAVPSKGRKLGFVQIEIPVDLWSYDPIERTWTPRQRAHVWVSAVDVNAPGDMIYHGPKAEELLQERREKKAAEQAKDARRFQRLSSGRRSPCAGDKRV